ncbi:MAG: DUF4271 domain-containing protein [Rikenellaceae bacterium]
MELSITTLHGELWSGEYGIASLLFVLAVLYLHPRLYSTSRRWRSPRLNSSYQPKKTTQSHAVVTSRHLLNIWPITLFGAVLLAISLAEGLAPQQLINIITKVGEVWILILYAAAILFAFYQIFMLSLIRAISGSNTLPHEIYILKHRTMLTALWASIPILLTSYLFLPSIGSIFSYLALGAIVICYILYLWRTFLIFAIQNISIFNWFLYLCGVELLPLSLLWALLIRDMA